MRPSFTQTLRGAVAIGLFLSSCSSEDSPANAPADPTAVSVASSSLSMVIRRSDTSDVSDLAVAQGDVLVVPAQLAAAFWVALGFEIGGPTPLSKFAVSIDETALPTGVETVPIGADGTFGLPGVDGDVLVCIANTGAGAEPGSPFQVNGCAEVSAQRLGEGPLVVDVGIAGVTLRRV